MFRRVLVANRGEIAVRVIRALHELGVEAVAVYSTADADALHVRLADEAVCIGPPPAAESYLRIPSIVAAGVTTGCEAVHPGYGFLSENAGVRRGVRRQRPRLRRPAGLRDARRWATRSPRGAAMRAAGVPTRARAPTARRRSPRRAQPPREIGYPVMLKAAAGGGGRGMRLVDEPGGARGRASRRPRPRRAPRSATARSTSRRCSCRPATSRSRCSATRTATCSPSASASARSSAATRSSIEETPSPALTPELREEMEAAAERACRSVGYVNAGTFEFLLGPDGTFSFIELNARLQVEHPVTELCTGIDLVRAQLAIAAGERLDRDRPRAAPRARDRDPPERRGSQPRLPARARDGDALPAAARPRRPRRHLRRGRRRRSRRTTTR